MRRLELAVRLKLWPPRSWALVSARYYPPGELERLRIVGPNKPRGSAFACVQILFVQIEAFLADE